MVIHENAISKSEYDSETHLLKLECSGLMDLELGVEQICKILDFLKDREIWGAIADIRHLRGSFLKLFDALRTIYYPAVAEKGHRCKAIVVSDDIITEHLAEKLKDLIREFNMEVRIFRDPESARIWILERLKAYYPEQNPHS